MFTLSNRVIFGGTIAWLYAFIKLTNLKILFITHDDMTTSLNMAFPLIIFSKSLNLRKNNRRDA